MSETPHTDVTESDPNADAYIDRTHSNSWSNYD